MEHFKLRDGRLMTIDSPKTEDAQAMIDFCNAVSGESEYLTFGPGEFGMTLDDEVKFIESAAAKGH